LSTFSSASLWLALAFLGLLSAALLYEVQRLRGVLSVADSLRPGTTLEVSRWVDINDRPVSTAISDTQAFVALFLSVACPLCRDIVLYLHSLDEVRLKRIVLLCVGASEDCTFLCGALSQRAVLVFDTQRKIAAGSGILGFPTGVLIDSRGRVISVAGGLTIAKLLELLAVAQEMDRVGYQSEARGVNV